MKVLINITVAVFMQYLSVVIVLGASSQDNATSDSLKVYSTNSVSILGDRTALLNSIPGSAIVVTSEQLNLMRSASGNEILRSLTGLNVVDEEGAGLRMNLGIRGLDPDRSRTLLVLEDGLPLALAPYGEPELYYTPSIDRMNSIEVLKGSGSIIHGPQTIGGVLNYITSDPPEASESDVHFIMGGGGYLNSKIGYGSSYGNAGFLGELYHKKADKIGLTNYSIYDFMAKAKFTLSSRTNVKAKIGIYDEISNSTYIGLTQNMFDNGEYFTEIAPNDELTIRRYSASLSHQHVLSENIVFNTSVYGYTTSRFWRRQDFSRSPAASNLTGEVYGDTSLNDGAIYMRNTTGNRNRAFDVIGVQPQMFAKFNVINIENELNAGFRLHYERAFEQRINGTNFRAVSGNLTEDEIRSGWAYSAFVQNRFHLNETMIITPGIRFEHFNYERDIRRISSKDTSIIANNKLSEFIPGIGMNYNLFHNFTLFAGLHRGFAPPRTKDAITNQGTALDLEAELSWNYEVGLRTMVTDAVYLEMTGFMLDFSNQIIPVSESSGGLGAGLINGGRTMHRGLETSLQIDFGRMMKSEYSLILNTNVTYSNAKYSSDRFIASGKDKININGNRLPYAPEWMFSSVLNATIPAGFGLSLTATYVGDQFADELNTINPSNDGATGKIKSYMLFDATLQYKLNSISHLFISAKNITDIRYIATRRPQGIKAGIPRFITAGIDYHF